MICLSELQKLVTCFRELSHSDASKPPTSITLKRKVMTVQKKKGRLLEKQRAEAEVSPAPSHKTALASTKFRMISSSCSRRLWKYTWACLAAPSWPHHAAPPEGHLDFLQWVRPTTTSVTRVSALNCSGAAKTNGGVLIPSQICTPQSAESSCAQTVVLVPWRWAVRRTMCSRNSIWRTTKQMTQKKNRHKSVFLRLSKSNRTPNGR